MSVFQSCLLFAAFLSVVAQPASLVAQELKCDSIRPLSGSPSSYKKRDNRCEGLYVADVGAHSLDVVSFTSGELTYDVGSKLPLRVTVASRNPFVNVRAVAIPPKTYYRMDTLLRPGVVMLWPVTDVLLPERLTDNRIGIFGWTGTENAKTFVPVQVVVGRRPTTTATPNVVLTIQPSFDAEAIKWRWAPMHRDKCSAFVQWQDAVHTTQVRAGQPVKIDLRSVPKQMNCLEVVGRSPTSNDWATLQIHVEIPVQ